MPRVYGYAVLRLRVIAHGAALVADNLDGNGLSLSGEWDAFNATAPHDADIGARRYWEVTTRAAHTPGAGIGGAWFTSTVDYGPYGLRGRVRDTKGKKSARPVYVDDATVYPHRHLVHVPADTKGALIASEVMGRSRVYRRLLEAFAIWFDQRHAGATLEWSVMADDEFREEFLDAASLLAVTVKQQVSVPGYSDANGSGDTVVARVTTKIEPAGWGERFPGKWIKPLLEGDTTPQAAFALDFEPVEVVIVLAKGQKRTIHLDAGGDPLLLYPLGAPRRRDRPSADEFFGDAQATLVRLAQTLAS